MPSTTSANIFIHMRLTTGRAGRTAIRTSMRVTPTMIILTADRATDRLGSLVRSCPGLRANALGALGMRTLGSRGAALLEVTGRERGPYLHTAGAPGSPHP